MTIAVAFDLLTERHTSLVDVPAKDPLLTPTEVAEAQQLLLRLTNGLGTAILGQARLSLYAGQAPSAGMQFSRDTAVYPIWPGHSVFESGQLDWTNTQNLTSGWLRSRTRTQFLTVGHRTERGRLEVTASSPDKLTVANGFEWGFAPLVVVNDHGRLFVGKSVAAGDSIDLQPATSDELKEVKTTLQRYPLELPTGMTGGNTGWGIAPSAPSNHLWHQRDSLMEQAWTRLTQGAVAPGSLPTENSPVPRTFFGVATQSPHIELGVSKATETHSVHTVMGRW